MNHIPTTFRAVGLAAATALGAACSSSTNLATMPASCVPEPVLFDWQRLDARNVLLWPAPGDAAYHLITAEPVDGSDSAESIEFADGNRDGLVCADGFDSLVVNMSSDGVRDGATIALLSLANARAVDGLQQRYAETRGRRLSGSDSAF